MALKDAEAVVVGAGPAGLAAGAYLARAGRRVVIVDREPPGGQARALGRVENYPGFPDGISGPRLMARFERQARRWGARLVKAEVERLRPGALGFDVVCARGRLKTKAVVVCAGARFLELGLPREKRLRGVYHGPAAACPGIAGRRVVVAGGGEAAAYQALALANSAREVLLVCRGRRLKSIGLLLDRLARRSNVCLRLRTEVAALHGAGRLCAVTLRGVDGGPGERVSAAALFVLVGKEPRRGLLPRPGRRGVFSAGDLRAGLHRQVAVAAGDGVRAGMDCERYLRGDR